MAKDGDADTYVVRGGLRWKIVSRTGSRQRRRRVLVDPGADVNPKRRPVRRGPTPQAVWDWLETYEPKIVSPELWHGQIREFVLPLMRQRRLASIDMAGREIRVLARITEWTLRRGMPLDVELILDPENVEAFAELAIPRGPSAVTYRSVLRDMGPALTKKAPWTPQRAALGSRSVAVPYTAGELEMIESDIRRQPTYESRVVAEALVVLGLGAGLDGRWNIHVRGDDAREIDGSVIFFVQKPERGVPVRQAFDERARRLIELSRGGLLLPTRPKGKNAANALAQMVRLSPGTPKLNTGRLRSNWLLAHLEAGTRLPDLAAAAGLETVTVLSDLLPLLQVSEPADFVRELRKA